MARPKKSERTLAESLRNLKDAGVRMPETTEAVDPEMPGDLQERIRRMLHIVQSKPLKATEMIYLIMYDISDNKVRTVIARYLERQGCIRVQRSVFIARSENRHFQEVLETLREVNAYYENEDSIILVPVNASDVRSMKLLGKNVTLDTIIDPPNTLFF